MSGISPFEGQLIVSMSPSEDDYFQAFLHLRNSGPHFSQLLKSERGIESKMFKEVSGLEAYNLRPKFIVTWAGGSSSHFLRPPQDQDPDPYLD